MDAEAAGRERQRSGRKPKRRSTDRRKLNRRSPGGARGMVGAGNTGFIKAVEFCEWETQRDDYETDAEGHAGGGR